MTKDQLLAMCYNNDGGVKPKDECRAEMINRLILDEMMDIDEAENFIDKSLLEFNLWGEPSLEELLRDDDEDENSKPPSS